MRKIFSSHVYLLALQYLILTVSTGTILGNIEEDSRGEKIDENDYHGLEEGMYADPHGTRISRGEGHQKSWVDLSGLEKQPPSPIRLSRSFNYAAPYSCVSRTGERRCGMFMCKRNFANGLGYVCVCTAGYRPKSPVHPECIDIDECRLHRRLCGSNGMCENTAGSYKCVCAHGWEGQKCHVAKNPCEIRSDGTHACGRFPCMVQSDVFPFKYKCRCPPRRYQARSEDDPTCVDIDECKGDKHPCKNRGYCENTNGLFVCHCEKGWMGRTCSLRGDPCINKYDGTNRCIDFQCKPDPSNYEIGYKCICTTGFKPASIKMPQCEDIDECLSLPCLHGGKCVNTVGSFYCVCEPGYRGKVCSTVIEYCLDDIRRNRCKEFLCIKKPTEPIKFFCNCTEGFKRISETNPLCEDIDECTRYKNICKNKALCVNTYGSYDCECLRGWDGRHCEQLVNFCTDAGANNNCGKFECKIAPLMSAGYVCICPMGFHRVEEDDPMCIDVNECTHYGMSPCLNEGICHNTIGSYKCLCTDEWSGQNCEIDINICEHTTKILCLHGGRCENRNGTYFCNCLHGWTGHDCEHELHLCGKEPCQHDGTCVSGVKHHKCLCLPGWMGTYCQEDLNECEHFGKSPCLNEGKCLNNPGSFACYCRTGFKGQFCEIQIWVVPPEPTTQSPYVNEDNYEEYIDVSEEEDEPVPQERLNEWFYMPDAYENIPDMGTNQKATTNLETMVTDPEFVSPKPTTKRFNATVSPKPVVEEVIRFIQNGTSTFRPTLAITTMEPITKRLSKKKQRKYEKKWDVDEDMRMTGPKMRILEDLESGRNPTELSITAGPGKHKKKSKTTTFMPGRRKSFPYGRRRLNDERWSYLIILAILVVLLFGAYLASK